MHGVKNFPLRKMPSDLDISLPDGTGDDDYLAALDEGLATLEDSARQSGPFDLAIYLAGADPYSGDRLGRLQLSKQGLSQRDRCVINWCRSRQIPIAIAMAGGYAPEVNDIVEIHSNTIAIASDL